MSLNELRRELACAGDVRFLNYAATAPLLRSSAERMARVAREGMRPLSEHFEAWLAIAEATRAAAAGAIGARADEITFTTNTSTALSLVAGAVRWRPKDRVLFPADEFPSNRFVWENLREQGVEAIPIAPEPGVPFAAQLAGRDLAGVRLVAVSHVSYRDGRVHDVPALTRVCRPRGILLAVDGIQAVGAIPVDVGALGCDFLACGGQKWLLGPVGSAFLYVARERLAELHVPTVGWASSRHAGDHDAALVWTDGAARFEGGLLDVAAIAGLGESLARLSAAGWSLVFGRVAEHAHALRAGCAERGLTLLASGRELSGIVAFRPPEGAGERIASALERARVLVTARHGAIRVAAHATTSDDEIAALFETIDAALGRRRSRRPGAEPAPGASGEARPSLASGPRLSWRTAIVTGASRGLGAAFAAMLARRGCHVSLLGRDLPALERVAEEIAASGRGSAAVHALDLADPAAVTGWIGRNRETVESAELLVNAAAWADASPFLDSEPASERAAMETNALAPMALARAVLPGMLARGRGHVINVVTSGARNALPLFSTYAASKAALWAWSEALSRELEGTGVIVLGFVPPHMDTATRRHLGRRAIGFYGGSGRRVAARGLPSPERVAERALAAAAGGRSIATPGRVRWETAMNALFPGPMASRVRRSWRGLRRPAR